MLLQWYLVLLLLAITTRFSIAFPAPRPISTTTRTTATTSSKPQQIMSDNTMIDMNELVSTCIDACVRGCIEIRQVQRKRLESGGQLSNVTLKDATDVKSALTEADGAAQAAIVNSLRNEWGPPLNMIGEEDDEEGDKEEAEAAASEIQHSVQALVRDLKLSESSIKVPLSEITIYIDPLDGTREFVEGRLQNCQTLIGIALNGKPIAGVMGLPFPKGGDEQQHDDKEEEYPLIVYGMTLSGTGQGDLDANHGAMLYKTNNNQTFFERVPNVGSFLQQARDENKSTSILYNIKENRIDDTIVLATGDSKHKAMVAAREAIQKQFGGFNVLYGGAGNKILATALGHVDCTIQHKYGGPWDVCAPQAVLEAMGGSICSFFGKPISLDGPNPCVRGFLATTGKRNTLRLDDLVRVVNDQEAVQEYQQEQQQEDS